MRALVNKITRFKAGNRPGPSLSAHFWVILLLVSLVFGSGGCGGWGFLFGSKAGSRVVVRPASGDSDRLLRNAHYLKLTGRPDLALKELEEAYQQEPHNLKVANALAQGYDEVGEVERAQKIYQEALARGGDNPVLSNNLCFSYYRAGNFKQAEACFRQTLARNPHNLAARNNLGMLLCRLGRQEEARRLWQEVETEAVAQSKVNQVLAALGMEGAKNYAATPPPAPPAPVAERAITGGQPEPKPRVAARPPTPAKPGASEEPLPVKSAAVKTPPPDEPESKVARNGAGGNAPLKTAAVAQKPKPLRRPPLTGEDLATTAIKVCNGNGVPNLAHQTRERLDDEGFWVAAIANYRDFGMEQTTIYYRPRGEKVARALKEKMFRQAKLEPDPSLAGKVDIQVVLGHDLVERQETLAHLVK